jgi:ABC-2 type transport system permease protein
MSATAAPSRPATSQATGPNLRVTFPRVVESEWLKLRSLKSSWYTLIAAFLAMVLLGALIGYTLGHKWSTFSAKDHAGSSVLNGYQLAELMIGVIGALFVTGEYATGMIRSTFAAVPNRLRVLGAKASVFSAISLATMTFASVGAFFAAQALLDHYHHGMPLTGPGVLRAVLGTGVYLALIGLLGGALGWILRSTAGAIATLVGILLIIPVILESIGKSADGIAQYMPAKAGVSFITSVHANATLRPWTGLLVLCAWVALALALAARLVTRRDA